MDAQDIVDRLGLEPHPEGGWFRETFRDAHVDEAGRSRATLIYFLLEADKTSAWHKVDATEMWLWHAGAPLELKIAADGGAVETTLLGADLAAGQRPQGVVPAHAWQSARPVGGWSLVSCAVAPAFAFEGFEMAAEGWSPNGS
ncbi:MAG: cupin domain-containing protein [Maricaulaceae bacterium]|jgi:predicted cupin superfamily sugar epimerase